MRIVKLIEEKLTEVLQPIHLEVIDESHLHAGHGGARPEGETHFRVVIVSALFDGESRVARHRMVTKVLAAEMNNPIHALALKTMTPQEADA
ncbi:MAG: BolA family transcriptional regulator [Parvibaculaceae bacterium]|nr:BolA family transcriptional regulator [Parvibaculaceae bacterium]